MEQALSLTKDHIFRHLDVVEVISGIVFLGTPHLSADVAPSPNIIDLILRLHQRPAPSKHALTADDNAFVARCCQDFSLLGIQVPIVSAYEVTASRVYQGMFKSQRIVVSTYGSSTSSRALQHKDISADPWLIAKIVPKDRSTVNSQHEILVAADKSHGDMCNVQVGGSLYKAIDYALQRSIEDAPGLIFKRFQGKYRCSDAPLDPVRPLPNIF